MALPRSHRRRCVVRCVSPTAASVAFHPARALAGGFAVPSAPSLRFASAHFAKRVCLACKSLVPCLPLRLSGRSRSKVCSSALVRASRSPTDSPRMTGATRAACAAQNRARQFRVKQVCSEVAALCFPPPAGVAPYPMSCPALRGEAGRWPALVVLRGAAMPRLFDSDVPRFDFHCCLALARPLRALRARRVAPRLPSPTGSAHFPSLSAVDCLRRGTYAF